MYIEFSLVMALAILACIEKRTKAYFDAYTHPHVILIILIHRALAKWSFCFGFKGSGIEEHWEDDGSSARMTILSYRND